MSKYKYHFFLILIGLSVITVVNGLLHFDAQNLIYPDSEGYLEAAKNVYIYHIGHNYRPMMMAAINGIPYLFGCSDAFVYQFSFYINLVCWLATALFLFEILKTFVSEKMAFLFSLSSFLFIGMVAFTYHLLSEHIYTLFIVSAFYFLLKYYKSKSFWTLSIALSIVIVSMLVRPGSKWLAIVFMLFYGKELIRNYKSKAALLLYGSWLLVLIQCAGIKYQFGNFTISYIDSVTYYNYLGSKAIAIRDGKDFTDVKNERGNYIYSFYLNGPKIKETAFNDLKEQLKNNKMNLFKAYLSNLYENATTGNVVIWDAKNTYKTSDFDSIKTMLFAFSKWQNSIFTLIGLLLGFYFLLRKEVVFFKVVAFYVVYIILISGISSEQGDRFHLVVFPFVLILLGRFLFGKYRLDASQL